MAQTAHRRISHFSNKLNPLLAEPRYTDNIASQAANMRGGYASSVADNMVAERIARLTLDSFGQSYRMDKVPDWPGLTTPAFSPWVGSAQPMTRASYPWLRAFCLQWLRMLRSTSAPPIVPGGTIGLSDEAVSLVNHSLPVPSPIGTGKPASWCASFSVLCRAIELLSPYPNFSAALTTISDPILPADHDTVASADVTFTWQPGPGGQAYAFALYNGVSGWSYVDLVLAPTIDKLGLTPGHFYTWSVMRIDTVTNFPSFFFSPYRSFRIALP